MMYRSESDKDVRVLLSNFWPELRISGNCRYTLEGGAPSPSGFRVPPTLSLSSLFVLLQLQLYIHTRHSTQPLPLTFRSSRCAGSLTIIHPPLSHPDPSTYTDHSPVKLHIHNAPCYQSTLADYSFVSSTLSVRSDASCTDHPTSRHV
jgi:hypothetical protein